MDEQSFQNKLQENNIFLDDHQLHQFKTYFSMLVEWNEKVNLTALTEKEDVYLKHFYDSISPRFYFPFEPGMTLCDIGAGAGFPSIPLLITMPGLHITIVDSLKKRIAFLENLVAKLNLNNVTLIHGRAEDIGQQKALRESFSIVTARAVARMSVLSEYCLPLCKIGGTFIALKGSNASEELMNAKNTFKLLGAGKVDHHSFQLPYESSNRSIICVNKDKKTPKKYPRKAGVPAKTPIL